MTIPGLWSQLIGHGSADQRVPFRIYLEQFYKREGRPFRVGIDAFMWVFELIPPGTSSFNNLPSEVANKFLLNFQSRIRELIKLHVSFVFVFDGASKEYKRRWDSELSPDDETEPLKNEENYDDVYKAPRMTYLEPDISVIRTLKMMLDCWNITYVNAPSDAEAELGRLDSCGVIDAIISNDGDSLMYGAKTMLRNFSKWASDSPASMHDPTVKQQREFYVTPVRMDQITAVTGLTRERIILIASLGGNDYTSGASGMGITRAFALAQIGTPEEPCFDRVDFSKRLNRIYRADDSGYCSYTWTERRVKLKKLNRLLSKEIQEGSKEYFGRAFNPEEGAVTFSDDYYIMMLFYPLLAERVFTFTPSTNNAEGGLNWFQRPHFKKLCEDYPLPVSISTRHFQLKSLSEAYAYRAIVVGLSNFRSTEDDLYIKSTKVDTIAPPGQKWNLELCQVKYNRDALLAKYLPEEDPRDRYDDNLNLRSPQKGGDYVWVPRYLIEDVPDGRLLISEFEQRKETSRKSSPGKRKLVRQSSTLDTFVESPIKLTASSKKSTPSPKRRKKSNEPQKGQRPLDSFFAKVPSLQPPKQSEKIEVVVISSDDESDTNVSRRLDFSDACIEDI